MKKTYITTAIPYVTGRPHIGFALELVQADVIARYHRLIGNYTVFQTGTDENALKNVLSAQQLGISTEKFVNHNAGLFIELAHSLDISFEYFIRTSNDAHKAGAALLWTKCKTEDIYTKSYEGLYCSECEDFYSEKDLINGICPDHNIPPVLTSETNYFFRLSAYQEKLEQLISDDIIKVVPKTRKNQVLSFIRSGLHDFSISRPSHRAGGWGVSVPGDPSQTIYVWFDALANYITGQGFGNSGSWQSTWNNKCRKIHLIGKNVWKFHAVYWPAILLSAGLALPNEIVVHGFLTENGKKISKSAGDSTDPVELAKSYSADALRYYLLSEFSPFNDGDFSLENFVNVYESRLANNLGNLVSRVTSLCEKAGYGNYCRVDIPTCPAGYNEALDNYEFDKALSILWTALTVINQDIDKNKPWNLLKEGLKTEVNQLLDKWLSELEIVVYWLRPFLPETCYKIHSLLINQPMVQSDVLFAKS